MVSLSLDSHLPSLKWLSRMAKFLPFTFGLPWGFQVVVCVPASRDKLLVGKFHNYTHFKI